MKFKKERKVLLIIVISAAMAVISMFMTDNSDKLFCSIELSLIHISEPTRRS